MSSWQDDQRKRYLKRRVARAESRQTTTKPGCSLLGGLLVMAIIAALVAVH